MAGLRLGPHNGEEPIKMKMMSPWEHSVILTEPISCLERVASILSDTLALRGIKRTDDIDVEEI